MKIRDWNFAFAFRSLHSDDRIERSQRDVHVARVRRDTLIALTENGVNAIVSFQRAAAAPGIAFVALRKRRVVKIIAARPLHEIAADRRHVAQLWARARQKRLAQDRVALLNEWMFR